MGKPILFDTISRAKFDQLDDGVKAKRNYQIKETDGKITKWIGGLEDKEGDKLPEVTSEDNGDVLTVVEGVWAKAGAPSSSNDFLVNFDDLRTTPSADKSYNEIIEAYEAGKNIIGKGMVSQTPETSVYFRLSGHSDYYGLSFTAIYNHTVYGILYTSNSITFNTYNLSQE